MVLSCSCIFCKWLYGYDNDVAGLGVKWSRQSFLKAQALCERQRKWKCRSKGKRYACYLFQGASWKKRRWKIPTGHMEPNFIVLKEDGMIVTIFCISCSSKIMHTLKWASLVSERCGIVVRIMREYWVFFIRLSLLTESSRNLSSAIESSSNRYCVCSEEKERKGIFPIYNPYFLHIGWSIFFSPFPAICEG